MGDQQLLVSAAQICQALAVGASSPGQLLLTAVVRRPDVLQGGLQKCLQGCGCVACTTCVLLETGRAREGGLVGRTPVPHPLHGAGLAAPWACPTGSP